MKYTFVGRMLYGSHFQVLVGLFLCMIFAIFPEFGCGDVNAISPDNSSQDAMLGNSDSGSGSSGLTSVWTGFVYHKSSPSPVDGRVASFSFTPPATGFVNVTAHYGILVRTSAGTDCHIETLLDSTARKDFHCDTTGCSTPGYDDEWVNGNLPTQNGSGTFLAFHQSTSRVFSTIGGTSATIFLNGIVPSNCDVLWGPITMDAVSFANNPSATLVAQ